VAPPSLFDLRFVVVSGKGGVGRTTMAAALARAAVRAGKKVLLAQMDSPPRLGRLFGLAKPVGPAIVTVGDRLDAVNMTAKDALHEYALMVLRYESVYRAVFENRAVRGFLSAIPGLDAYAMLGKAWWHTTEVVGGRPKYDLVIIDGPASGHATTMLKIPDAILHAMPKGPLSADAGAVRALLSDPARAAFLIVTLAEELPARETAQLAREARQTLRMPLGPLVVNAVPLGGWGTPSLDGLLGALPRPTGYPGLDATLEGAALLARRRHEAERVLARLQEDPGLPIVELPRLPTTDLGPQELATLSDALYAKLASR
jgi:Mrp family chromosome partitioning ATPase